MTRCRRRRLIACGLLREEADEVARRSRATGCASATPPRRRVGRAAARGDGCSASGHGLERPSSSAAASAAVRRPPLGAQARPQPRPSRSSTTRTSCSTRRCCPGAAAGTLEPRHVVVPLREQLARDRPALGSVRRARTRSEALSSSDSTAARRGAALRPADRRARLDLAHAADPRAGRARASASRRCRRRSRCATALLQTLEQAETSRTTRRAPSAAHLRVRRRRLRRASEGLAELQDFAADVIDLLPALPRAGLRFVLVEARDRVMTEIQPDLAEFAERELRRRGIEIRTNTTVERSPRPVRSSTGEVVPCRTARLDGGRQAASGRRRASACRSTKAGASRSTGTARSAGSRRVGDRRRRRGPRPGGQGQAVAADGAARDAPGPRWRRQRRRRGGEPGRRRPFRYRTLGRVRRHGPPPGGRQHAGHPLARLPGLVPRPHVPPARCRASRAARGW